MLLLLNAGPQPVRFALPALRGADDPSERRGNVWAMLVDSASRDPHLVRDGCVDVEPQSVVLLRHGRERRLTRP
jgi:hypothetical protein